MIRYVLSMLDLMVLFLLGSEVRHDDRSVIMSPNFPHIGRMASSMRFRKTDLLMPIIGTRSAIWLLLVGWCNMNGYFLCRASCSSVTLFMLLRYYLEVVSPLIAYHLLTLGKI